MLSFDMSAIRSPDAPGNANASPNGLYGEQACHLCRYAGINSRMLSAGFYEFNPSLDSNGQTAILLAQMIWYFMDEIGRASCRERVCQYVWISVCAVTLKKKK